MSAVSYRLKAAAEATGVSVDLIRRALNTTDPAAWPPPLTARRIGNAANAPLVILADDLAEWIKRFPEAV